MKTKSLIILLFGCLFVPGVIHAQKKTSGYIEKVYQDKDGIVRWTDSKKEVALFGANYPLASATAYRAAGYITNDRKKVIDQDMAHFARMGYDGLRLILWGDWENTDYEGNLLINDHLDLLEPIHGSILNLL